MSFVRRLKIQGIRAFDPDGEAVVEFERPLTIILGDNGCGKTTIIECLKYITTGQVPPNTSRGRDFVHDPSILGRAEIKAQVRLLFGTASHEVQEVTRSLQVQSMRGRAKSIKLQTLDGVRVRMDRSAGRLEPRREEVMKGSALDEVMPQLLGVPRAILEHVIFCHQEESTWPLQESAQVKKHFDDIFATTRYSKAMDEVKGKRKELEARATGLQREAATLTAHAEEARRLRMEVAAAEASVEAIDSQRAQAKARVSACESRLALLHKVVEQEGEARLRADKLKSRAAHSREAQAQMRAQLLQDYKADPDECDRDGGEGAGPLGEGAAAAAALQRAREEERRLRTRLAALEEEARGAASRLTSQRVERASAQERARALARAAVERRRLVEAAAAEHGLEPPRLPQGPTHDAERAAEAALGSPSRARSTSDGSALLRWAERFAETLRESDEAVAGFVEKVRASERVAQAAVAEANHRHAGAIESTQAAADTARAELSAADTRMVQLPRRLGDARSGLRAAQEALASMGPGAEASVERELEEQELRVRRLAAAVERNECSLRGGDGAERTEVVALQASVRRLRRWKRAVEERAEALRAVAANEAEARAVRAEAERARAGLTERLGAMLLPLVDFCGAEAAGLDAVAAAEALREVHTRIQSTLASAKKTALAASATHGLCKSEQSQLVGQHGALQAAQEQLTARLQSGDGATAWDSAAGAPVQVEALQARLAGARQALAGELSRAERLQVVSDCLAQLKSMLVRSKACPLCGKQFSRELEEEQALMEQAVEAASTSLRGFVADGSGARSPAMPPSWSPVSAAAAAASSSTASARAAGAAISGDDHVDNDETDMQGDERVAEAQQLLDAARQWHEGHDKLVVLQRKTEATQRRADEAAEALKAAEQARDSEAMRSERCSALLAALTSLAAEWRGMLATERRALGLHAELGIPLAAEPHRSSSSSPSPTTVLASSSSVRVSLEARPGVKLRSSGEEEDAEDARVVENAALHERSDDEDAIASARAAKDAAAVSAALSRLGTRLQLREEDTDARRQQLAAKEAELAEHRQKLARGRQAIGELTARRSSIAGKSADVQRAKESVAALEREQAELEAAQATVKEANRRADEALQAARAQRDRDVAAAQEQLERARRAVQDLEQSGKQLRDAGKSRPLDTLRACEAGIVAAEADEAKARQAISKLAPDLESARKAAESQERMVSKTRLLSKYWGERHRLSEWEARYHAAKKELKQLRAAVIDGNLVTVLGGAGAEADAGREEEYWDDTDIMPRHTQAVSAASDSDEVVLLDADDDDDDDEEAIKDAAATGKNERRFRRPDETESVQDRAKRLETRLQRLRDVVSESNGRERTLREQIGQREARLASKELRDVKLELARTTIELRTTELAVKDLVTFYRGLDRALMRYHELQIEQANETIRDLWGLTYQGRDIESIQIRSDASELGAGKRRTYNYRVVMTKGGSELDMRGRCSAGQKVLACLIIRLALRKAFAATSCGVLALDEPTTNLDEANKKALAHSLASIITLSKDSQRHFQLIVITHDLDFIGELNTALQTLGAGDGRPRYVNVVSREEHSAARGKFVSVVRCSEWGSVPGLHG